jgi:hypothetical protein
LTTPCGSRLHDAALRTVRRPTALVENRKPGVWERSLHAHAGNRVGQPVLPRDPFDVTVTVEAAPL